MAQIIPEAYHPRNAVKTRRKGAFNIHVFKDGGKLIIRRSMEKKMFETPWQQGRDISSQGEGKPDSETNIFTHEKSAFFRRKLFKHNDLSNFIKLFRRINAARVRFEQPVAWVKMKVGDGRVFLVTRASTRDPLEANEKFGEDWEFTQKVVLNVAREVGKLHGAGLEHGHLHPANVLADDKGNATLVDPKMLRQCTRDLPPRKSVDLSRVLFYSKLSPADREEVNSAYEQGFRIGKKRTRELRATD